jgi:hypothetical protein
MTLREITKELRRLKNTAQFEEVQGEECNYHSLYLGSYMSLDPCGRYHHAISPNGVTSKCMAYWERLEKAAQVVGGWIEAGEGDPTDIYFCY